MGADFIFACARVRGAERNLLGREKLGIMTEAKTMEDALKVLSEAQYGNEGEVTQPEAYERLLEQEPYPAPRFVLDPAVTDFYAFTKDSVRLEGYQAHELNEKIPVAV